MRAMRRVGVKLANLRQRRVWRDGDAPLPESPANETAPPDWVSDPVRAYAEIQKARAEAASTRAKLREREAGYQREVEDLRTQIESVQVESLRVRVAGEMGIPASLAERLRGVTEEELRADAEALRPLVTGGNRTTAAMPGGAPVSWSESQLRAEYLGGGRRTKPLARGARQEEGQRFVFGQDE